MNFVIVVHQWHVLSKGFFTREIEVENELQAEMEGLLFAKQKRESIYETSYTLIPFEDTKTFLKRKLTLKERITGKLKL